MEGSARIGGSFKLLLVSNYYGIGGVTLGNLIEKQVWKDYIGSGNRDNYGDLIQLVSVLYTIKDLTKRYNDKPKNVTRHEFKKDLGINIPYTASFNYILKYIDKPQLIEVVKAAFRKIEKNNPEINPLQSYLNVDNIGVSTEVLSKVILELDSYVENQFIELKNDLSERINQIVLLEKKKFEEKRNIVFKGEIPISINNSRIYDNTFIVEQWIRRILIYIMMSIKRDNWIDYFNSEKRRKYKKIRLLIDEKGLSEFNNDNILLYRDINELINLINKEEFNKYIKDLTGMQAEELSEALMKVKSIRNEMAHNRTISTEIERVFDSSFEKVEEAIKGFKQKTIYDTEYKIVYTEDMSITNKDSPLIEYFENLNKENINKYGGGLQAFIAENAYSYSLVLLPCSVIKYEFIDVFKTLSFYKEFRDYIIAFYMNKDLCEYQVIIPRNINEQMHVYKRIVDTFFDSASLVGTKIPYEHQEAHFTCNPKIWFYDNLGVYE